MHENWLCSDLVAVEWQATNQEVIRTCAVLDHISPSRACLQLEHSIPATTVVKLLCGNCRLRGKVSYCRFEREIGYLVEVDFIHGERWSMDRYQPPHMLNPKTLPSCLPPCAGGACPKVRVSRTDGIRQVAREVARVCGNLDADLLTTCFHNLFGESRPRELLQEFIATYREARGAG
jgi:hypothetical protein